MTSEHGLSSETFRQILDILYSNPRVSEVILFGSRAKGNFRESSDIDLALKGDGLTRDDILNFHLEYEKRLFPWKLDLILFSQITESALREHIQRVGKKISRT